MISVSKLKNSYYISTNKQLLVILLLQVILFKDVLIWIFNRLNDNSDEISSITSLISLFIILFLGKLSKNSNLESEKFDLNIISYTFLLYFLISFFDIDILKGLIASFSLSITASFYINRKYFDLKIFGLLLLSLPILTSFQFFVGYPLRVLVTKLSAILLKLSGLNVLQEATCLTLDKNSVCVDAPCSGIQMLLTGFFLCFIFSFVKKLNNIQTILLLVTNILIVIFVNIFRATALFYTESGILLSKILSEEQIKTYDSTFKNLSHES
ncbi:MAG: archaeosortase/exosortase family protein, partial [Candidatus Sericytochromatia bacterium]